MIFISAVNACIPGLLLTVLSTVSGPPGRYLGASHGQKLSMFGSMQSVRSFKQFVSILTGLGYGQKGPSCTLGPVC